MINIKRHRPMAVFEAPNPILLVHILFSFKTWLEITLKRQIENEVSNSRKTFFLRIVTIFLPDFEPRL